MRRAVKIISVDEAEQAARGLRASLTVEGVELSHGAALEHVAHAAGYRDWNTLAARLTAAPVAGAAHNQETASAADDIEFARAIPILRIFDEAKAREFYVDYLGFSVDWEHRFEPDLPLYLQVSRSDSSCT